jgi:hypothetical protein
MAWASSNAAPVKAPAANRIAVSNLPTKNAQPKANAVFNKTATERVSSAQKLHKNPIKICVPQKHKFV